MIHVIIGAPCAGKSTYVRENAKTGDVIVDYDRIAQAIGADGHLPTGDIKGAAFAARKTLIDYVVTNDCESWIIHTSPSDEQRKAYEDAGAEFIVMDTDMETCLQRMKDDERPPETETLIRNYFSESAGKSAFLMPEKGAEPMKIKSFKAALEMTDGGIIAGYASTFDRVPDAYGDIVAPGAFANTLEKWAALNEQGKFIPLLWGHDTNDPMSNIGRVIEAYEDEKGLYIRAEFDAENERAQYVRKLAAEGRVYQFSFAYEIKAAGEIKLETGARAYELQELELFEVSVVQIPANQFATVEEVKNALVAIKAGRRNSKADADELRAIAQSAQEIIDVVSGLLSDSEADDPDGEDKREDGETSKGANSQAEIVAAYKQAIYALIGE